MALLWSAASWLFFKSKRDSTPPLLESDCFIRPQFDHFDEQDVHTFASLGTSTQEELDIVGMVEKANVVSAIPAIVGDDIPGIVASFRYGCKLQRGILR
jgi:hypothetical protein